MSRYSKSKKDALDTFAELHERRMKATRAYLKVIRDDAERSAHTHARDTVVSSSVAELMQQPAPESEHLGVSHE